MRLSALIPIGLCATALVLTFLCLFAGSSKGFMETYAILTLNASEIGHNLFNTSESSDSSLISLLDNITNTIESDVEDAIMSVAKELGVHDFYSWHLMDYCEGYYKPGPVPNATLSRSSISKNVTSCSDWTGTWNFDPRQILQKELDESGHGDIDLVADLNWPEDVDKGLRALRIATRAMFVFYAIAIGFIGIALISAVISAFFSGRLSASFNVILDWLAFLVVGVASAIATAIAVKGTDVINHYGDRVGISARQGGNFLIITWVATGLMLLASIVWCVDCVVGSSGRKY